MAKANLTGQKAQIVDRDPRDVLSPATEDKNYKDDDLQPLCDWIVERVAAWEVHRRANYEHLWDEYERLWRGIYSPAEKERKSERSRIISPALAEAVENSVSEIEEAIFGRGDFFEIKAESADPDLLKRATDKNKRTFKEDLSKTDFVTNVSEALINAAVYGVGIGEILVKETIERDITPEPLDDGTFVARVTERNVSHACLRSVNPRNFLIDPRARGVDDALGCAIEEEVGAHLIREGQESGEYRQIPIESAMGDPLKTADPQITTQYERDGVPTLRYYGLVPRSLLLPAEKVEKLFPEEDTKAVDPGMTTMVEAIVVIMNRQKCLKATENPDLMKDRPVVAFQWDVIPGRFQGRGVCEKGNTPQRLLDAELRSRQDALAYSSAPMMAMDASRLPRGFKFSVYPGKSLLLNGDPSTILRPFKFGEVDQNTWQQAQMLDQLVQRATGAIDAITMAQRGVSGEARSGAVSMSLSGIVKRNKRTMMRFIDRFMGPALRKMLWRGMQYDPQRYVPINFTFLVTSTVGIMQREYEIAGLTQLLGSMQPGSIEYLMILGGIIANTGLQNRLELLDRIAKQIQTLEQQQQMPQVDPNAQVVDPMVQQLQQADMQLELAKKQAEIAMANARARLYNAQANTESIEPEIRIREMTTKGIYAEQENQNQAFNQRMKVADQILKRADIESNERIASGQIQGSIAKAAIGARAKAMPPQPSVPPTF